MRVKETIEKNKVALKKQLGVENDLALPKLQKVIIACGVARVNKDKNKMALIADRLAKISGQKAAPRGAKKSIASFKVRAGETVGLMVTLRGRRMYGFLDKLLNIAIPRIRDFRGLNEESIDAMGNLTIGLREHTIFPETADEELKDVFGLAITVVSTAKNKQEALIFFRSVGFPFRPV